MKAGWQAWQTGARWWWRAVMTVAAIGCSWIALGELSASGEQGADPSLRALLARDAPVRVQVDRHGAQWLEGRVVTAPLGCTLVRLDAARDSVPLAAVRELQQADGDHWRPLPVDALRAGEPAGCAA